MDSYCIFLCIIFAAFIVQAEIQDNASTSAQNTDKILPSVDKIDQQIEKFRFTFGTQTDLDKKIASGNNLYSSNTPQNYRFNLSSPPRNELRITFIEIEIETSSKETRAFISAGKIGQEQLTITVEALHSTEFVYKTTFYNAASHIQTLAILLLAGLAAIYIS